MPQTQKGSWFLHYKEKMDEELIDTIKATIYEIWKTKERVRRLKSEGKGKAVPKYLKRYLRTLDTNLNKMRSVAVYYKEYSCIDNLQLLGETEENLLEHRTDGTDAFDTLYIGAEKFPYREIFPITASEVL